jgi:hypothetical protein
MSPQVVTVNINMIFELFVLFQHTAERIYLIGGYMCMLT